MLARARVRIIEESVSALAAPDTPVAILAFAKNLGWECRRYLTAPKIDIRNPAVAPPLLVGYVDGCATDDVRICVEVQQRVDLPPG